MELDKLNMNINQTGTKQAGRRYHVAIDIGAGSGRLFAGYREGDALRLDELYRFQTGDLCLGTSTFATSTVGGSTFWKA